MLAPEPQAHAIILGQVIASLRKQQGLGQQDFSAAVGVSQATLSRIERGQASPDHFVFTKMAEQLGLTPADLEGRIEEAKENTRRAAAGATGQRPEGLQWEQVLKIAGVVGLIGLAAFAVAAALSEDPEGERPKRS